MQNANIYIYIYSCIRKSDNQAEISYMVDNFLIVKVNREILFFIKNVNFIFTFFSFSIHGKILIFNWNISMKNQFYFHRMYQYYFSLFIYLFINCFFLIFFYFQCSLFSFFLFMSEFSCYQKGQFENYFWVKFKLNGEKLLRFVRLLIFSLLRN